MGSRRVQRWCAARVPGHARHQVRVECELAPRHLTIIERRAPWRQDAGPEWTSFPIARLRYSTAGKSWTLYWRDRNLRFHSYDLLTPSPTSIERSLGLDNPGADISEDDVFAVAGAWSLDPTTLNHQTEAAAGTWGQLP